MPAPTCLGDLFVKDIARSIDGVIRAGDVSHLGIEVEEYVFTNEIEKNLARLLDAYVNYTSANGVWISGFFGSGKSHMLKMLAHLLGDVQGQGFSRAKVVKTFELKTDDAMLQGSLTTSATIPATSLLFNIAEEAADKGKPDALLRAFVRVFNESRGYTGKHPHVAQFESDLDRNGLFDAFKEAFVRIAGAPWEDKRAEATFQEKNVASAYSEVSGDQIDNILAKYRRDHSLSIGDFTDEVSAWLAKQADSKHRIGFYVDEIGQFIGTDVGLMLELQTIVESLNTKCAGRAWVFVTSQEDMEKTVGDRSREQSNDFSKIQARFNTRINLTSHDVDEVIRKRLLEKTSDAETVLETFYAKQKANFKTYFDFADGAKSYQNYPNESSFVGTYPFVNYHFTLFHQSMEGMSTNNVFEGRYSSVGERSMLATVQHVAKGFMDEPVGMLATFDRFYGGLESDIKDAAKSQIEVAKRNLNDEFAVRVLQTLFLVKFVDGFQASLRNLTVLLFDSFDADIADLQARVKSVLDKLEAETYIERNGIAYSYMTNEEQAMEGEIKAIGLDSSETSSRMFQLLSGDVLKSTKYRYDKTGQDMAFGWMIDDQAHGPQKALTIHAFTPASPYDHSVIRMQSAGRDELRLILNADTTLLPDIALVLKTEKYVKQKHAPGLSASTLNILQQKTAVNDARRREVIERLRSAVAAATLIVNAEELSASSKEAVARVEEGLKVLVGKVYPNLNQLGGAIYAESDISRYATLAEDTLVDDATISKLTPVADEVYSKVAMQRSQGAHVTVKSVVDTFEAKPYGWPLVAIQCALARLVGMGALSASIDANVVRKPDFASNLRNTAKHGSTVLIVPAVIDPAKLQQLRSFAVEFFDEGGLPNDALDLARTVGDRLKAKRHELVEIQKSSSYPFMSLLAEPINQLSAQIEKPAEWYFEGFLGSRDALLESKDMIIAPISAFLNGDQKKVYDDAAALLIANSSNVSYLPSGADAAVRAGLDDPNIFRGNRLPKLKTDLGTLLDQITELVNDSRLEARESVEERATLLRNAAVYGLTSEAARRAVETGVARALTDVQDHSQIALIAQTQSVFDEVQYPHLLDLLHRGVPVPDDGPVEPEKTTVMVSTIKAKTGMKSIETELELDKYLSDLKATLLSLLNNNKRIGL